VALTDLVAAKLELDWSPQQIAGWLKIEYPNDPEMQVSHESIYRSLFVQSRGSLRKELTAHLRTKRATRRPAGTREPDGRGGRPNILHISQRPAEAADRAVPGQLGRRPGLWSRHDTGRHTGRTLNTIPHARRTA